MKNTIIDLQGSITKENGKEFTEDELEQFIDDFLEVVESKGCALYGRWKLFTEKEHADINKERNDTSSIVSFVEWWNESKYVNFTDDPIEKEQIEEYLKECQGQ